MDDLNLEVDEDQDPVINALLQNLCETRETAIEERQCLPKPYFSKPFFVNLDKINNFLPNLLSTDLSLRDINDIVYAAAKTLIITNK